MKKILILCYTVLIAAFILPLFFRKLPEEKEAPLTLPELQRSARQDAAASETAQPGPANAEEESMRVLINGEAVDMAAADYLTGVVAAEMPASFEFEALRAQAVAARTYAMYCESTGRHSGAQVCTDSGCCQAWLSRDELKARWGADYDVYYERLRAAVTETAGEYLSYEGQPVFAAFHSSSAGTTEDSGRVWNSVPYLISVSSPESAETVPGYVSTVDVSRLDFRDSILASCPEADFSTPEETWIGEIKRTPGGRVESVALGGREIKGTALRSMFSLRSTAFELEWTGEVFRFTVTGYGHGVGMSQYGANVMAQGGADYREILAHYYPGTELVRAE